MTKPLVCIQGLGFVGAAMAVACARAGTRDGGAPCFDVVGLDLPTKAGKDRIAAVNEGRFPFGTTDRHLLAEMEAAHGAGNLRATDDLSVLAAADVIVVDIHFDVSDLEGVPHLNFDPFRRGVRDIGTRAKPGALVVIETTVPPGTCEKVVRPELDRCCVERGLPAGTILLAHAYERVMPGDHYLRSITDFWRVFAGETAQAGEACERFLSQVVNTQAYPLTRLGSTTASETAKVLENSYRALNIAFMDEWGRFAEQAGIDLFEVVNAIRMRPTHSNIRQPGFGVGGYCLTKDPLFASLSAEDLLGLDSADFPLCRSAVRINQQMPLNSLAKVRQALGGLAGRSVLLAGISYRQDVSDTRYSPSQTFYEAAVVEGAEVSCHDPLLDYWDETRQAVTTELECCPPVDAVVFAVPHKTFAAIDPAMWLGGRRPYVLDANNVLTGNQIRAFAAAGCVVESIGRGSAPQTRSKSTQENT